MIQGTKKERDLTQKNELTETVGSLHPRTELSELFICHEHIQLEFFGNQNYKQNYTFKGNVEVKRTHFYHMTGRLPIKE